MQKKNLFLIDGTYYLYNSYYIFPLLKNNIGEPTGAIFGIINMIYNLIDMFNPKYLAIIFDHKSKNFRNKLFKRYKSNRLPMPTNLIKQIKPVKKIIKYMGIKSICISGIEADDVIGTIAKNYTKKNNNKVFIKTNDQDMFQLITKNIKILTKKNEILDKNIILKRYGISPKFKNDHIALSGDKADNIPGISGIGKVTANKLIQIFGNIENIYKNINKINIISIRKKKEIIDQLKKNKKKIFFYKSLATIKTNIKLNISNNDLLIKNQKINKLKKIFKFYQLNKFLSNLKKY
ncbi:hypothetical protein ONB70_01325 [Candidatus Purcelliella pentastirinorum]|uniref:5'-3' exonuclease n=1 Tax=Candidatus Purcelliella pentastirinorum TaxID=472834 RepID=UPI00237B8C5D|nr:5'-3' exonuclease H3TH domain-containing protein [Candidatus Purcelliella pentastirinorum]WDR80340.1 hypothetical protein ONB70_01325 [Candidatus Purcelliella pentastirinorum]